MTHKIAHISDTNLSAAKPFFVAAFKRCATWLEHRDVDLVVHTGDVSLDGACVEEDLRSSARMLACLPSPVRCIPGNHDLGESIVGSGSAEVSITDARRHAYRRHFGPDFWACKVPGWCLIGINAQLLGSGLDGEAEQLAFVEEHVVTAGGRALALFTHKPLFDASADEAFVGKRFVNPAERRRLLACFASRPPALVCSGHVHQFRDTTDETTRHVWAPSTAFIIPDRKQPRYGDKLVGYVEHQLRSDGTHGSELVIVPQSEILDIADFPEAYGPVT